MKDISAALANEIADNWEQMAETEEPAARRETLRECADLIRMLANRGVDSCARANRLGLPFHYCPDCPGGDACELPKPFSLKDYQPKKDV